MAVDAPGGGPGDVNSAVLVTPSYGADFERCRLLCETVDRHVAGFSKHYLLVEGRDVAQFNTLRSLHREVIDERDLLPSWLKSFADPTSLIRRRIWLSLRTRPLRGWHVQQMRRIALAKAVSEQTLIYVDSDVAFLRPFDCGAMVKNGRLRLLRRDHALAQQSSDEHRVWSANAGRILGLDGIPSDHDYIGTLIAWDRRTVLGMIERIEDVSARSWVESLGASRQFSECMIYGRYVDDVLGGSGHVADATEYCRVYWTPPGDGPVRLDAFVDSLAPHQVAVGIQSFIGVDIAEIRRIAGLGTG